MLHCIIPRGSFSARNLLASELIEISAESFRICRVQKKLPFGLILHCASIPLPGSCVFSADLVIQLASIGFRSGKLSFVENPCLYQIVLQRPLSEDPSVNAPAKSAHTAYEVLILTAIPSEG